MKSIIIFKENKILNIENLYNLKIGEIMYKRIKEKDFEEIIKLNKIDRKHNVRNDNEFRKRTIEQKQKVTTQNILV